MSDHIYMLTSTRENGVTNTVYVSSTIARILQPHALNVDYSDPNLTVLEMSWTDLTYAYNEE